MEIPLKVAELDHVVLRCRDQERAYDFYTRVLGLSEERRIAQIGLIQLRAGRSMIDLVPASGPRSRRDSTSITYASGSRPAT
ncbi:MAG: VOC family protein [Candidatus Binatus sp.]|uniref:VOC family protein n=1 Tax=Candidatus Binatus sp. TaxID=2811406 RepID=UPI003BB0C0FF